MERIGYFNKAIRVGGFSSTAYMCHSYLIHSSKSVLKNYVSLFYNPHSQVAAAHIRNRYHALANTNSLE